MKDNGIVQGGENMAVPIFINHGNVYVHTNIKKIKVPMEGILEDEQPEIYQYDEKVYTQEEYYTKVSANETSINDLTVLISEVVGSE